MVATECRGSCRLNGPSDGCEQSSRYICSKWEGRLCKWGWKAPQTSRQAFGHLAPTSANGGGSGRLQSSRNGERSLSRMQRTLGSTASLPALQTRRSWLRLQLSNAGYRSSPQVRMTSSALVSAATGGSLVALQQTEQGGL